MSEEGNRPACYGISLRGEGQRHWLVFLSPEDMKDMPANLKPQERAKWLFKSVKTPEQIEDLKIHRVQQRVATAESSIRIGVSFAAPMAFAIVGVIANRTTWLSYLEEEEKAMRHVKS